MKLSKQQLKTSTRHYIKKCAGAVCTSKLHESARNSERCVFGQFGSALKSTKSKRKLLGHGIFCSRALKPT